MEKIKDHPVEHGKTCSNVSASLWSNLGVINGEEDYDDALLRISDLMNTNPPDSEELEELITAVEAYENEHHPVE